MGTRRIGWSAVAILGLLAFSATATAALIVAGGKKLTADKATYTSDKVVTGGGNTHHAYRFAFATLFQACDVIVRMEDENGKEITPGPAQGITGISVTCLPVEDQPWVDCGSTTFDPPTASGKLDLTTQVPTEKPFRVDVSAKATVSAVKFTLSFSTKPEGVSESCTNLDTFSVGDNSIIARPFFPATTGLLLRIRNDGLDHLGFGRFELIGSLPGIDQVIVLDTSFTVLMEGSNAFTVTGDAIAPSETIEVFIIFETSATAPGALIARFTQS